MTSETEAPAIGLTHGGSEDTGLGNRGPQSKSIVVPYGFWLFVLSDMVLFSALFATYASLVHATDGGPVTSQLFDRTTVAIETLALLISSFICGLAMIAAKQKNMLWTQLALLLTGLFGLVFLVLELTEFAGMITNRRGAAAQRFPVVLLHARRLSRRARHRRPVVDRDDDGTNLGQGLSAARHQAAAVP